VENTDLCSIRIILEVTTFSLYLWMFIFKLAKSRWAAINKHKLVARAAGQCSSSSLLKAYNWDFDIRIHSETGRKF